MNGLSAAEATARLILLFNAALGLYQEQRSEAALTRLKALAGAQAWVLRDADLVRLPTHVLVPGDWVRLEAGDRVPADGTLTDARGALFDESILTGESVPVDKGPGDEAFSGTLLVRGKTFLEVTRTGALRRHGSPRDDARRHPARKDPARAEG
jgi:Ca2+-transporting ATPase